MCEHHYAKFEHKVIQTFKVTDYRNQAPSKHFGWKNV